MKNNLISHTAFAERSITKSVVSMLAWILLLLPGSIAVAGQATYASRIDRETAGQQPLGDDRVLALDRASDGGESILLSDAGPDLPALSREISLRLNGATLEQALMHIATASGLELAYLGETVAVDRKIDTDYASISVLRALNTVLRGTGLTVLHSFSGQLVVVDPSLTKAKPSFGAPTARVRKHSLPNPMTPEVQTGTIVGTVADSTNGETLVGATVVIEGTQQGASTGLDGDYVISVVEPGTYSIRASYIGYAPRTLHDIEVAADDTVVVDFRLSPVTLQLDEVVAIGYGTAERKDLTGSVGSIDADEMTDVQTVDNVSQLLQGKIPGLSAGIATEADGETTLQIRGRNSIQAANEPLIVVDGVPFHHGNLSDINPNDVASIDVLKGASAAAVYGASAAAGVIEVTTKRGTTPGPQIQFKSSVGIATQGDVAHPYGPDDYIQYRQDAQIRLRPSEPEHYFADPRNLPSDISLEEWIALGTGGGDPLQIWLERLSLSPTEIENYMNGNVIDWHNEVYRTSAFRQNYDLSVSGRPEKLSYYWSVGYVDNQGENVGSAYKTVRSRLNLSVDAVDWLEFGVRAQYANQNRGFLGAHTGFARASSPYGDMYAEDGTLEWFPHEDGTVRNPFLYTTESGRRYKWRNHNVLATLFGSVDLPMGLGFVSRFTNDYNFRRNYLFNPSTTPFGEPAGNAKRQEFSEHIWQLDNILSWNHAIGTTHEFDATFLFNVEVQNAWITDASNEQFAIEDLGYGGLPLGANPTVTSDDSRQTANALMGRLNYRLLDRYLFTVSYRRDGYSAFGQQNPYAYFPSAAFAWRISEEPFFGFDAVNDLKLRLSWGKNGNRSIGAYSALQRLGTVKYIYDTETFTGIFANNLPNRGLKWETTTQYNAGLDFGFNSGRVSGSIDAYYMSTTDLLLRRSLPDLTGYSDIWSNLGEVVNRGLELSLSTANILKPDFGWMSGLTFSMNRNEIKHLYGTMVPILNEQGAVIGEREADDRQNGWFIGHALDEIYDYEVIGVWQEDEADAAAVYGKEPGDFKLRDVNGDGILTPVEDKVFQGFTEPRLRLSLENDFTFRDFSASFMLTSHLGQYTAHNVHRHTGYQYGRHNQLDYPYWTPNNPTNEWARLSSEGESPFFNYWEATSFVRLQNVSVSYRVPERFTGLSGTRSLRVFFNARNVFVLTGFDGDDPETYNHTPRLYTLGVNLAF